MKINLIRNLDTQRDKEQEDSFEKTMNPALYFDMHKKITKVDGWKITNVKRLVESIDESSTDIDVEFSKWNDNTEYIFSNSGVNLIHFHEPSEKLTNSLRNCDLFYIHDYLKEIKDDKNLKLEFLFTVAEELKGDLNAVYIINEFINNGISTIDVAIDTILPLLMLRSCHD